MSRYVEERRHVFGVEPICRAVGVPVSTYYARRSRKPSARTLADRELVKQIHACGVRKFDPVREIVDFQAEPTFTHPAGR